MAPAAAAASHARPDLADYNVIAQERANVSSAAAETHRALVSCGRAVQAKFTTGLRMFNDCASLPLRHNIYRARVESPMLLSGVANLKPGPCRAQALGVGVDLSTLADISQSWFGLWEQGRAALTGPALSSLRRRTHSVVEALLRLSASVGSPARTRTLAKACRPRPYDGSEHGSAAAALRLAEHGPRT